MGMMENIASPVSMRAKLADAVEMAGGQAEWARKHGFSAAFVCQMLSGQKEVSINAINALGYVRREIYIPVKGQNS